MGGPKEGTVIDPETGVDQSATAEAVEEPTAVDTLGALTKAATISARTETPAIKPRDTRPLMRGLSLAPHHFALGKSPAKDQQPAKVSAKLAEEILKTMNGGSGHGGYSGK